jgi:hypothetical protein
MTQRFLDVDPRDLRVTSSRLQAPIWVYEGSDGVLVITNGVTRATRIAKLVPGLTVPVEVIGTKRRAFGHLPKIGGILP